MGTYIGSLDFSSPPQAVFDYLADLPKHSEWAQHPLHLEATNSTTGQGATFRSTGHMFGKDNENAVTVLESTPTQRIVWESVGKEGRYRHSVDMQANGSGTHVTKSVEVVKASGPAAIGQVLFPFILPKAMRTDLARIKTKVP